jgi:DNA-binding MarR family transcriptional regulator
LTEAKNKLAAIDEIVFLGRAVERLSVLIAEQSKAVFDNQDIVIPVRSCSLMTVLSALGTASAADLARELGHSHQLVMQKIPKLLKLGLIRDGNDENDARRRVFRLTDEGISQLEKFEQCKVLMDMVARTTRALTGSSLEDRIKRFGGQQHAPRER